MLTRPLNLFKCLSPLYTHSHVSKENTFPMYNTKKITDVYNKYSKVIGELCIAVSLNIPALSGQ